MPNLRPRTLVWDDTEVTTSTTVADYAMWRESETSSTSWSARERLRVAEEQHAEMLRRWADDNNTWSPNSFYHTKKKKFKNPHKVIINENKIDRILKNVDNKRLGNK